MTKLEQLIHEYCPYGVERVKLTDVADVLYGYPCDASKFNQDKIGTPLIRIRDVLYGKTDTYTTENVPSEYIIKHGDLLVGMDGNFHVGNWKSDNAFLCQRVCKIYPKHSLNKVTNGYLSHLLGPIIQNIENSKQSGTVKHLLAKDINAIQIPVPPLPIQEEIVRILDKFTELEEELAQELARRKQQYAFYRDQLLNFESTIKMRTVQQLIAEQLINVVTPSFKIKRNDYCESGLVPIISQEAEYISGYFDKKDSKITKRNYVCFGDHSEHIKFIDFEFVQGADGLKIMHTNESGLLSKYLYYALSNFYTRHDNYERHFKYLTDTTIPVPSLDVQQRLVNVLDNFDAICSDLSIGLPAEISARQKQYEYYRDLLFEYAANGLNYIRAHQSTSEHIRAHQSTSEHIRAHQSTSELTK